jgi:ribonucleoside-triphosphate reductase
MATKYKNVAKAYITYRYLHGLARDQYRDMMDAVAEKLSAKNVQNQNANVDEASFGGRIGEASDVVTKKYALEYLVSPMARANHENNEIYIHDLNAYAVGSHNCLSIPFDDLLAKGFNTRQTDVRPAQSINTAFQLVAVIFQIQSLQQFGGVSATHLDWTMVPYVRKSFAKHYKNGWKYFSGFSDVTEIDYSIENMINNATHYSINDREWKAYCHPAYEYALEMTVNECKQAVEGMYHNLNTLMSRSGNQLPFTSINYGTCTLPEGRMITKALIEASIKGIGKLHKTPIFPCGIFQCMKGVNRRPGDPNYDLFRLALKSTSQRLYPNYANVDWSGNAGYDVNDPRTYFSTMGCRTANGWDINGLGQLKDGRGNICPVTIIMPTLAMQAKERYERILAGTEEDPVGAEGFDVVDYFLMMLNTKIHEAKDMLLERFEWICSQSPDAAKFMYENNVMAGYVPEEGIRSALKHGTIVIGQLGLAETLQILIGCDHTEERGMELAKKIEQLFKDRCAEFKNEYKLNFGVYYTPAENLCYTAMQKFKGKYGEIPNVSDKEFFTNSIHVPVWKEVDPFTKIDIESQLTGYSSAGCITYVELDSTCKNNLEALETLVSYAMDKDIPYFAINVPNDTCMKCGYTDELNDDCPMCGGEDIQRLRRVTGYLTGNYTTAFNKGKQQEVEMRVKHDKYGGKE